MTGVPRLSVGLPVYNGEKYLAESLDALLRQSYPDFELILADNASTDGTEAICRDYAARDPRIRYYRHERNLGACPNHNFAVHVARGELFKWASHDDLYGEDLLLRCVQALDEYPDVVLAHSWNAIIDGRGNVVEKFDYRMTTDSPSAPERFRSLLFAPGGDDFYGVIRTDVLRRTPLNGSYHHSDRTIVAELALHGRFHQVPELLYFRRDHPDRAERACPDKRARAANMDPRRANRWRNPTVRLLAEYVWAFVDAIRRAPISAPDKRACYRHLARYLRTRTVPVAARPVGDPAGDPEPGSEHESIPGRPAPGSR